MDDQQARDLSNFRRFALSEPTTTSTPSTYRDVLWLVALGALGAGLGEVGLRFALLPFRELLGSRVYLNPQSVWMGPFTTAVLLLVPVSLTWIIARKVRGGAHAFSATVLAATFLSLYAVAMITRRVSDIALAALALGVASQVARFASAKPALARLVVRRLTVGLGVTCLALTAWVSLSPKMRERRILGALPEAPAGAPNVLLLVLDTVRGLETGVGGYARATTPNIDRYAARGVVFDRAIAAAPWTLPSHASMFTGKWPHELGVGWSKPFEAGHVTLAERLNSLGYATGGFVANVIYCSYLFGLQRGFSSYHDYQFTPSEVLGASTLGRRVIERWNAATGDYVFVGRKDAAQVNAEFLSWEADVKEGRPWFAFLNYFDAHDPYDPEEPWRTKFPGTEEKWRSLFELRQRSPEELSALQSAYDGSLAYLDDQVGKLLDDLDKRGVLRNTIVIITSDHGEEFGEHGHTGHGSSLYSPVIHVPLVILPPGDTASKRVARMVSLRDLAATIEDAASPGQRELPGFPLSPLWRGDSAATISPAFTQVDRFATLPARYPVSKANLRSLIVDDRWHFIRTVGGKEELFDLRADYMERTNLIDRPEVAATVQRLRDSLTVLSTPK